MVLVVAAAVAEVDAAHKGDILLVASGMVQHHQLLVLAAGAPDPLIEQDLAAGVVHHLAEMAVLLLIEVRRGRVRAPQQPPDLHATAGQVSEDLAQLGPWPVQALVGVTAPVGEVDQIAGTQLAQLLEEPWVVGPTVDERLDQIAHGPGTDAGRGVAALPALEEPALQLAVHWGGVPAPIRSRTRSSTAANTTSSVKQLIKAAWPAWQARPSHRPGELRQRHDEHRAAGMPHAVAAHRPVPPMAPAALRTGTHDQQVILMAGEADQ